MRLTEKKKKEYQDKGYDLDLISRIQPEGGLVIRDRYVETGSGYTACLHIYELAGQVNLLWLVGLTNIPSTVATIDVATADKQEVINQINRSSRELISRAREERHDVDRNSAHDRYLELQQFASNLINAGEIAKLVHIRIFFSDASQEKLEQRMGDVKKELKNKGYKSTVYEFRAGQEFDSLFFPYDAQSEWNAFRAGEISPSRTLGAGLPFHHQSLIDPQGIFLGHTTTNGSFIFDPFYSTPTRKSFNGFLLGKMGYGKSTILKLLEEGLVAKNTFIRGFDKARDFHSLIKSQQGMIINLAGENGEIINPLEIFVTSTDVNGMVVNEYVSFMQHVAKVTNMFKIMYPSLTDSQQASFRRYLREFYIAYGILTPDYNIYQQKVKVTGLDPERYPVFSEFRDFLDQYEISQPTKQKKDDLETIKLYVEEMVDQYGPLFNGHTTINGLENEGVLFFDIDSLSNLDENVFHAQLFSALTIIWSHALNQGRRMRTKVRSGEIQQKDIRNFMVFMDEAHNIINANNVDAVRYITNFQREMRKFNAGVFFATQTPAEVLPESASNEAIDEVKKVFELCQYKIFLNLDASMMGRIRQVLGNTLTDAEFDRLTRLQQGEAVVQLSSAESLTVKFTPTPEQLDRFDGGQ